MFLKPLILTIKCDVISDRKLRFCQKIEMTLSFGHNFVDILIKIV